jgi:hypothetical protein
MPTDILRMVAVAISTRKKMLLLFQSYEKWRNSNAVVRVLDVYACVRAHMYIYVYICHGWWLVGSGWIWGGGEMCWSWFHKYIKYTQQHPRRLRKAVACISRIAQGTLTGDGGCLMSAGGNVDLLCVPQYLTEVRETTGLSVLGNVWDTATRINKPTSIFKGTFGRFWETVENSDD